MSRGVTFCLAAAALLLVPAAHPLLIPYVGVPSHLLWWLHVLPAALVTYRWGRRGAAIVLPVSGALVVAGERTFGAGYGAPAHWATVWALFVALTSSNLLVVGFALYARRVARRYQLLFDAALSGVIRADGSGRVEAANPAALKLLDVGWSAIRGRRIDEIPQLRPLPPPREIEARGWSGVVRVGRKGHESELHLVAAAVAHDDPPGHQILLVDRTHEVARKWEDERRVRLASLGEAMAGVAHELRNPLGVVTAWAHLGLASDAVPGDMRESLAAIREQAERMADLVNEMLGFARARDNRSALRVDELVSRIVRMQRVARGARLRIVEKLDWKGEAPLPASRLEQILVNLLSNAADAVPRGRGVVEVALCHEGGHLILDVSDNGPGVPIHLADRIFDPFVTGKPEALGTGLGLAISRRLAASMGGSLVAGRAALGGARFTLRVPLDPPPAATAPAAACSTDAAVA